MNKHLKAINKVSEECEGTIYKDYSGRGMFGEICVGIVGSDLQGLVNCAKRKKLPKPCWDNMGLDYIIYWPSIKYDIVSK